VPKRCPVARLDRPPTGKAPLGQYNHTVTIASSGTPRARFPAGPVGLLVLGAALLFAASGCRGGRPQYVGVPLVRPSSWSPLPPVTHHDLTSVLVQIPPRVTSALPARPSSLLDQYLAIAAARGPSTRPELFPSDQDVLAYLINAHIAWALKLDAASEPLDTAVADPRAITFPLDGGLWSLARLTNEILARAPAEPRIVLFLNPGFRGGPPLPPAAVEGYSLAWQIAVQGQICGSTPGFWALESGKPELRLTGFTRFMPGLPTDQRARARILLDLVPPPTELRDRIFARCGPTLQQCAVTLAPVDTNRWRRAASPLSPSAAASARA